MPTFTVIIASRPSEPHPFSLKIAQRYAPPGTEFIVACGSHPAIQRNQAAAQAKGDILLFLDDDSEIQPHHFTLLETIFQNEEVVSAGGPSLGAQNDSIQAIAIQNAMASRWLTGPSANRYQSKGARRFTDQSELILCNQAFRRLIYLQEGGLDERLYPNEENELMDRLKQKKFKLVYDPELAIFRPQRTTLFQFLKTLFRYGCGRSQQTRLTRLPGWWKNYLPLGFVLTFLILVSLAFLSPAPNLLLLINFIALFLFFLPGIIATLESKEISLLHLVPLGHFAYASGLFMGLFIPFSKKNNGPIILHHTTQP